MGMYDEVHVTAEESGDGRGRGEQVKLWAKGLVTYHLGDDVPPPAGGLGASGTYQVALHGGGYLQVRDHRLTSHTLDAAAGVVALDTHGGAYVEERDRVREWTDGNGEVVRMFYVDADEPREERLLRWAEHEVTLEKLFNGSGGAPMTPQQEEERIEALLKEGPGDEDDLLGHGRSVCRCTAEAREGRRRSLEPGRDEARAGKSSGGAERDLVHVADLSSDDTLTVHATRELLADAVQAHGTEYLAELLDLARRAAADPSVLSEEALGRLEEQVALNEARAEKRREEREAAAAAAAAARPPRPARPARPGGVPRPTRAALRVRPPWTKESALREAAWRILQESVGAAALPDLLAAREGIVGDREALPAMEELRSRDLDRRIGATYGKELALHLEDVTEWHEYGVPEVLVAAAAEIAGRELEADEEQLLLELVENVHAPLQQVWKAVQSALE